MVSVAPSMLPSLRHLRFLMGYLLVLAALLLTLINIFKSKSASSLVRPTSLHRRSQHTFPLPSGPKRDVLPIVSRKHPWGAHGLVELGIGHHNPSILRMPPGTGALYVTVARSQYDTRIVQDIEGQPVDIDLRDILAALLEDDPTHNTHAWPPDLNILYNTTQTTILPLIRSTSNVIRGCVPAAGWWFRHIPGPEDARLFWSALGEPLLTYNSPGSRDDLCRQIYLVDARVVMPELNEALERIGWNDAHPVRLRHHFPLYWEGQGGLEKNWALIAVGEELYVHTDLAPRKVWSLGGYDTEKRQLVLTPLHQDKTTSNCFTDIRNASDMLLPHQTGNFIPLTLCNRGECKPTPENTVLTGFAHWKFGIPGQYERRVITLKSTPPFDYVSMSPPLTFVGATDSIDTLYVMSHDFFPRDPNLVDYAPGHGFLDDLCVISIGKNNNEGIFVETDVIGLMESHTAC
ncbi:hypothetical protein G7K_5242-t1 [Saitoella complicata NRRL Y-17804]|uniref:Uncharacterized protein n=1 Tax=Saitoella complicata (strain BCRC 22490 / CBS 7301 / JCM 7358 / NBRC 10748 / NRRL Y-17804) TaxID=698492 RepID=A0A0E9NN70_SAICN|nr:hypothetical protein G7K_5242-t1 [Saitoella complicata NRRL Y-17804]